MATLISFIRENMEESVCVFCGLSCIGYLTYQSFFVDDGMNGKVPNGTVSIYSGKAIVINNPNASRVVVDGGRTMNITGTLLIMYDDNLVVKTNDVVTIGSRKYNVIDCVNVDNLNVYYNISLDGILNEENGYE